jgi:hypothetical protein
MGGLAKDEPQISTVYGAVVSISATLSAKQPWRLCHFSIGVKLELWCRFHLVVTQSLFPISRQIVNDNDTRIVS